MARERRRAFYSGRVQGVGFRFTAQRFAAQLPVDGFVRNLPDQRVELLAEGEADNLDQLLASIATALDDKIHAVSVTEEPIDDVLDPGFTIRF